MPMMSAIFLLAEEVARYRMPLEAAASATSQARNSRTSGFLRDASD
jgi:hypothetical protein